MMTYDDIEDLIREYGHERMEASHSFSSAWPNVSIPALAIHEEMQALKSEINVLKARLARAQT